MDVTKYLKRVQEIQLETNCYLVIIYKFTAPDGMWFEAIVYLDSSDKSETFRFYNHRTEEKCDAEIARLEEYIKSYLKK